MVADIQYIARGRPESKFWCIQISSFSLYVTYEHNPAEHRSNFDLFLVGIFPHPWYEKRYWPLRDQCQENPWQVGSGRGWMGMEGEKKERKHAGLLAPPCLPQREQGYIIKIKAHRICSSNIWIQFPT